MSNEKAGPFCPRCATKLGETMRLDGTHVAWFCHQCGFNFPDSAPIGDILNWEPKSAAQLAG